MRKTTHKLPNDFLDLPRVEQRRILVQQDAARFKDGDPDAWFNLLLHAVTDDPDIPGPIKVELRARLIQTMQGSGTIDPHSPEWRAVEQADMEIYAELMSTGGKYTKARNTVAKRHGVGASAIERAYRRHLKRWPRAPRLDGRRK